MDQENKTNQGEETKQEITPASAPEDAVPPEKNPYSKQARAWAWVGIAFMVFLTIMYFYYFYSGLILHW